MVEQSKFSNPSHVAAAIEAQKFEHESEILQVMIDPDSKTSKKKIIIWLKDKQGNELQHSIEVPTRFKELATINATTSNLNDMDKYIAQLMWYHANTLRDITETLGNSNIVLGKRIHIDLTDLHNIVVDDLNGLETLSKGHLFGMAQLVQTKRQVQIQQSSSTENIFDSKAVQEEEKKKKGFFKFF